MEKPNVKETLVTEGLRLMLAASYEAVGIQDVVKAAGVPKGSFYYYFSSKEAFGEAVIDEYTRHASEDYERVVGSAEGDSGAKARAYFEHLAAGYRKNNFSKGCLYGNLALEMADRSERLRARVNEGLIGWERSLGQLFRSDASVAARTNPDDLAKHLIQSWEGALIRMRAERSDRPLELFFRFSFAPQFLST